MTPWTHEPEFRRMMRQCCDGAGISSTDFDRLVEISRTAPPEVQAELTGLIRLMAAEAFPPDA